MDIGKKLRVLRLGMNLTQQELANRLSLTKGYISQIENNLTSPSLSTLFEILAVLGTTVHEFFSDEVEQVIIYKKEFYKEVNHATLKIKTLDLIPDTMKFQMEPMIIELEPGGQTEMDDPHHGEEFGFVMDGQITLVFNKKRYIIRKGESFYYKANKEHFMTNNGQVLARVIWVTSPPKI
jgi:transcriptional regulator with XRE-family HTH domain